MTFFTECDMIYSTKFLKRAHYETDANHQRHDGYFFDLLIFTKMVKLKQDGFFYKAAMYLGCACIIMAYFFSTYIFHFPAALSSALTMSIPSFLLFFWLSEYRDSRFLMTFCFVDSVSLIIAFLGRYAGILTGSVGEIISFIVILLLFSVIVFCGWKSFQKYHTLLAITKKGWNSMAVSTLLIYIGLLFFAAYPKPLVERIEYGPVYLLFSVIALSFYVVFISSILKTKQIYEQNLKLEKENEIYQIAYTDALTGLGNRAAYIEHINEIERSKSSQALYCCVILDVNQFKSINDSHGTTQATTR